MILVLASYVSCVTIFLYMIEIFVQTSKQARAMHVWTNSKFNMQISIHSKKNQNFM
jgi:hypothetical protein